MAQSPDALSPPAERLDEQHPEGGRSGAGAVDPAGRPLPPGRPGARWRGLGRPLGLYACSRVVVLLAGSLVVYLGNGLATQRFNGPWPLVPAGPRLLQALGSWDGSWYLLVARHGYFSSYQETSPAMPPTRNGGQDAFFPGFPTLIRVTADVTGLTQLTAGVLLALVFGAVATVAIWLLVRLLIDQPTADRTAALWVFFPGSFVLSMVYAEGLTVAAAALCLLLLLRQRWVLAGLAAAVATASQPEALALVPCCAWAAGSCLYRRRDRTALIALAAPVLSLAGVLAFFSYLAVKDGDLLRWYHVEHQQWKSGDGLYHNSLHIIGYSLQHPTDIHDSVVAAFLLFTVVGIVLMVRWRPPAVLWIYTGLVLVAAVSSLPVGTRGRVVLVAFPLIVAVARLARGVALTALVGAFGVILGTLTILTLTQVIVAP
jgi:hypothetical protein